MCTFIQPCDIYYMKNLVFALPLLLLASCSGQKFPETMPKDFKVEYHLDGGMANMNRTIVLQNGECTDKGRPDDGEDYNYKVKVDKAEDLEKLYADLKKINAFLLKSRNGGDVMDRGGEYVEYIINGKTYKVDDHQSMFIEKKDAEAFNQSLALIINFAEMHREPAMVKGAEEKKDTLLAPGEQGGGNMPDNSMGSVGQESIASDEDMIRNKNIPTKMPEDFKIKYEMGGGISGSYRVINLQFGTSTDESKPAGGSKTNKSWVNKSLKDFQVLYTELYKLNSFGLKYTTKGNIADRGGEKLIFTINGMDYIVSDKDNDFLSSTDKAAFKKSIALILDYVEKSK
jgi:hypothetical protein